MLTKIMNLKSLACTFLEVVSLGNGEKQTLNRLVSLVDSYLLSEVQKESCKNNMSVDSYMLIKLIEVRVTLRGYDNKTTYNIIKALEDVN